MSEGKAAPKRFCLLVAGAAPEDLVERYGTYEKLYKAWLQDDREEWDIFITYEGQLPPPDTVKNYHGFVITGSKSDAHAREPWIIKLEHLVQDIYANKQKLLGVCFGHQLISNALHGKSQRAEQGWEVGAKLIKGSDLLVSQYGFDSGSFYACETHRDQVVLVPPEGLLLASSERCPVEMYQVPAENPTVLCMQFHPEFTVPFLRELIGLRHTMGVYGAADIGIDALRSLGIREPETVNVKDPYWAAIMPEDAELLKTVNPTFMKQKVKAWFKA